MKYAINSYELFLYYCIWISAVILSFYKYLEAQNGIFDKNPTLRYSLEDLVPGWTFLGRVKDISDIEWSCWKYYIKTIWLYLVFQFFVSESLRKFNIPILKCWYIISSLLFIWINFSWKQLFLVVIQPVIFFFILACGGKQVSIWITGLILLLSYNTFKYKYYIWDFLEDVIQQDEEIFLLLFAMAWIELKCISFCMDYVENKKNSCGDKHPDKGNLWNCFINMFSYVLYLPLLYVGPVMLYEDFENSFLYKVEDLWTRLKRFAVDMILFGLYSFLLDLALHYIYFCAMHSDMKHIKELSSLALCGGGLWMGFQFYIKYVISYGTTSAVARLDNIDAPPTPRCIARIHVYSQMWRYFDVGLYKFLLKYIYKPTYKTLSKNFNLSKTAYKLISSLATFSFIFLWHGTLMNIFIWSTLNYCSILMEQIVKAISTTSWYKKFKVNVLRTEAMEARFVAFLCAPLLTVSAMSNFYLFGGTEVGNLYAALMTWPALHNIMIALVSTYCCSHVSMALSDVRSRTDYVRPKIKVT